MYVFWITQQRSINITLHHTKKITLKMNNYYKLKAIKNFTLLGFEPATKTLVLA